MRVWAEVSDKMADNEFVYVICQCMQVCFDFWGSGIFSYLTLSMCIYIDQTGRVMTVVDNRDRLEVEAMAGG